MGQAAAEDSSTGVYPFQNLFLPPDYNMSSVGALLVGTPAKINPDLLSGSGVLVDSVNGLHGDVLLAAGAGMSVATNAGTNTVTYTNAGVTSLVAGTGITVSGATGAVTVSAPGAVFTLQATASLPNFDPYVGADFLPFLQIAIPAAYQTAKLYRVSIKISGTPSNPGGAQVYKCFASTQATCPGTANLPADALTILEMGSLANVVPFAVNGITTCAFQVTTPAPFLYVFAATDETDPGFSAGIFTVFECEYVLEVIN